MKVLVLAAVAALAATAVQAQDSHYVRGYTRSDGTYVQPHYQTNPNNTVMDNWSTKGNVNPYTGAAGTRNPYPSYTPAPSYTTAPSYTPAPSYGSPYGSPSAGSSYGQPARTCTAYGCY